tara:strand:+ start:25 stop:258 length:234 start_codon:yes stop_codon:yes gene_type:complete
MSENNQIWEYEELMSMYDDISNKLYDQPELLEVFRQLVSRGDMNYETETSSSDEEIDDAVPEELEVQKSEEGFYSLA